MEGFIEWWIDDFDARREKAKFEQAMKTIATLQKKVKQLETENESLTLRAKAKSDDGD